MDSTDYEKTIFIICGSCEGLLLTHVQEEPSFHIGLQRMHGYPANAAVSAVVFTVAGVLACAGLHVADTFDVPFVSAFSGGSAVR